MDPSVVRNTILAEHHRLRDRLHALVTLAEQVRAEPTRAEELLRGCEALRSSLSEVQLHEDQLLVPALEEADAWAEVRIGRLLELQKQQQDLVKATIELLTHRELPVMVRAAAVVALGEEVERELTQEDRELLSPDLLRDDVITIGGNAG